jgi:hypothetical protein
VNFTSDCFSNMSTPLLTLDGHFLHDVDNNRTEDQPYISGD